MEEESDGRRESTEGRVQLNFSRNLGVLLLCDFTFRILDIAYPLLLRVMCFYRPFLITPACLHHSGLTSPVIPSIPFKDRQSQQHALNLLNDPPSTGAAWWHDGSRLHKPDFKLDCPIACAFSLTTADPSQLSYGSSTDTRSVPITDLILFEPEDHCSKYMGYWTARISELLDKGWRICYTDGSGKGSHVAAAIATENRRNVSHISTLNLVHGAAPTLNRGSRTHSRPGLPSTRQ